jgi:hypothetical protein
MIGGHGADDQNKMSLRTVGEGKGTVYRSSLTNRRARLCPARQSFNHASERSRNEDVDRSAQDQDDETQCGQNLEFSRLGGPEEGYESSETSEPF